MAASKTAIVLGGGGSRGIAHVGVLDVLTEANIPIDMIVGTSMGAIVGALFASGLKPHVIAREMSALQGNNIFSMNIFSARARQRDIRKQMERQLRDMTFADLQIPMCTMAVDVITGQEVAIDSGPLIPAILASAAVPAVFPPVQIDSHQLVDGGVIDSLATPQAHAMNADNIIAVDIYPPLETDDPWIDPISAIMGFQLPFNLFASGDWTKTPGMVASMWRSFRLMAWHIHQERIKNYPPDVLLTPDVSGYGSLDFTDVEGPYLAGRLETEKHLDAIKALFADQPNE